MIPPVCGAATPPVAVSPPRSRDAVADDVYEAASRPPKVVRNTAEPPSLMTVAASWVRAFGEFLADGFRAVGFLLRWIERGLRRIFFGPANHAQQLAQLARQVDELIADVNAGRVCQGDLAQAMRAYGWNAAQKDAFVATLDATRRESAEQVRTAQRAQRQQATGAGTPAAGQA